LGLAANNTIWIDATADGYGWYVDNTSLDDAEFNSTGTDSLQANQSGAASGHIVATTGEAAT